MSEGRVRRLAAGALHWSLIRTGLDRCLSSWTIDARPGSWPSRIAPGNTRYAKPTVRQRVIRGICYEVDLSDFLEWRAYTGFATEPVNELLELLQPGQTAIEVGANIGETFLRMARKAGPDGRVLGFEPDPANFSKCRRNLQLNVWAKGRAQVFPHGLGARPSELSIATETGSNRGSARLRDVGDVGGAKASVFTLDETMEREGVERVHLIHLDAQGMEGQVLCGAKKVLSRDRPTFFVWVADFCLKQVGSSARELLLQFEELGYVLSNARTGEPVSSRSAQLPERENGITFHMIARAK